MADEIKEPKKNKALLFVIVGTIVVMIVLIGVIAILLLNKNSDKDGAKEGLVDNKMRQVRESSKLNDNGGKSDLMVRSSDYLSLGPLYPLDSPFVVNLITQNGRRYLKTSITLELSDAKLLAEVKNKETAIKDTIIEILSSKSIEEISTLKGKNKLKEEIRSNINSFLIDGFVKNVFFTEFVVQ
ncbi:flagellar basal body-associated protein FliL [Helicobacter ailurogastricus]|uniref:Flagellar protein FliL n=1 Tax=Helicobacter ailurogastricus TaxID=1578720 RepID=A0A0K2X4W2_9HELI|nr:flagellar basal body-associated protein FliL [Helicobacter ailurogastricus]CRF41006.1 Flagellar biosynthesis protein FliL [Helicobacter ailurogastricus]CRF42295.1 Flagellar biosynthesis protein FliL [Helicobacter ailurogastricus]CRF44807.1 Flagellar biosynthesis protein FliL [Helicobacter ailurogastricus]GLH57799.1 Flagellar basal body-associated protein FliL [Helicobacter ailurogastricus]GLH59221.1 Flagellar basal body-associated protein FliL [Helicobacter ailurogastricus]